ncbi:TonB-dependent receptor [Reichenbachiella sp. MALMAid0571]|uniref:TonB-dependent receptor domain-containing protein n=1 Tax=Reichenbachiella sp. MALMAid0571 TaxID=3143939 RepID=UPI0032DE7889
MQIKLLFLLLTTCLSLNTLAQKSQSSILVQGKVVDKSTSKPLDYATIALVNKEDKSILAGGITDSEGTFSIKSPHTNIYIEVSFLGYNTVVINDFKITGSIISLPNIEVQPDQEMLTEVTVTAEKSKTTFELDKRVFNVGKDLTSAGGNALDVLNNVPSVDVNIEGQISLRGNTNVQILINGKPSVMASANTIGTIAADMIEKVEVITNPSAKYDAEGTTGIINIVLKKEDQEGLNGSVTLNVGHPTNRSVGLSLNRRTNKFNLFSQLGVGKRSLLSTYNGETIDRQKTDPKPLFNSGSGGRDEQFYNVILGTDYNINPLNVITLSGHFAYEIEDEYADTHYDRRDANNQSIGASDRNEATEATNPKYQYDLSYKKSFEGNKDRSFTASFVGSYFGKDQSSEYTNTAVFGDFNDLFQRTTNDYSQANYSFQTDYVHPFSKISELESGIKYEINDISNDYELLDQTNNGWVSNPDFTNLFNYDQRVLAAYTTYAYELQKFGLKVGLRIENTNLNTFLQTTGEDNNINYNNVFPSVHSSYKISDELSLQMGYSKRIHRPNMWDLNPFTSISDNLNRRSGNPELQPEFTDVVELSAIQIWGLATLSASLYHSKTDDVVTRVISVQDSLTITKPYNLGTSNNTGLELNASVDPLKWWSIALDGNWVSFSRTGTLESNDFDFSNTSWSSQLTNKFKFPFDIEAEVRVDYQSKVEGVQGISDDRIYADFGVKKKFMKGRAVVNFSVRDVFKSRKYINISDQDTFYRYNERLRGAQQAVLGFSYGFGKGDAMEFSGHKMF